MRNFVLAWFRKKIGKNLKTHCLPSIHIITHLIQNEPIANASLADVGLQMSDFRLGIYVSVNPVSQTRSFVLSTDTNRQVNQLHPTQAWLFTNLINLALCSDRSKGRLIFIIPQCRRVPILVLTRKMRIIIYQTQHDALFIHYLMWSL